MPTLAPRIMYYVIGERELEYRLELDENGPAQLSRLQTAASGAEEHVLHRDADLTRRLSLGETVVSSPPSLQTHRGAWPSSTRAKGLFMCRFDC